MDREWASVVAELARWVAEGAGGGAGEGGRGGGGGGGDTRRDAVDDAALLARIMAGDERALEALFLAHASRLYRVAYPYLQSGWAARAVVQDIFTSLWNRRADLDVHGSVTVYLTAATRNRAMSVLREEIRRRERDGRWAQWAAAEWEAGDAGRVTAGEAGWAGQRAGGAASSAGAAMRSAIERALAELPERQRLVFRLRVERQLTSAEVRDAIGAVSVKAVELLYARAVKSLRARLMPDRGNDPERSSDPEREG